jgi:hypothetical protein
VVGLGCVDRADVNNRKKQLPFVCEGSQRHGTYAGSDPEFRVDIRLPKEKGNSDSHGARPVHQIISMIKWIRTSRLSMKKDNQQVVYEEPAGCL